MTAPSIFAGGVATARLAASRSGIVTASNPSGHTVRVRLEPEGQETGWIPDMTLAAGGLRIACPSEIGTQVVVGPVGGDIETPHVVGKLLSDTQVLPPVSPITGGVAQPGELLIMAGQGAPPVEDAGSAGEATAGAGFLHITPSGVFLGAGGFMVSVTQTGVVMKLGGVTATLGSDGFAVTGGTVNSDTDVLAAGISGIGHVHPGVQRGGALTNGPQNA